MKQLVLVIFLILFISGCQSTSFDDTGYVWENWDLKQQAE